MKQRKIVQTPVIDKNYLNELYTTIHDRIQVLDRLNEDYKTKQEEHFIHSFMNVVEKMGNDLILAQEAYRNIDIQVKRDQYCMELAAELQFFRTSCFQLKTALEKTEKTLTSLKIEKENADTQMVAFRLNLEKKITENMQLKAENKQLLKKIRQLTHSKASSIQKQALSIDSHKFRSFKQKQLSIQGEELTSGHRQLVTQGGKRRQAITNTQCFKGDERMTDSHTPNSQYLNRYDMSNLSNPPTTSFRRKSFQRGAVRASSDLFK